MEDAAADAQLLCALGVGLGPEEMYSVMLAAKRLGEDPTLGVATVRFFGKFFGVGADYFVYETTLHSPPEEPDAKPGTGWRFMRVRKGWTTGMEPCTTAGSCKTWSHATTKVQGSTTATME